jgi:hypothetical protein
MENQLGFLLKLLAVSALLSVLIKYSESIFVIPTTAMNALLIVVLPTLVLAIALLSRLPKQKPLV